MSKRDFFVLNFKFWSLEFVCYLVLVIWCLLNFHCFKLADLKTHPASNTFFSINFERFSFLLLRFLFARDRFHGAGLGASAARGADIGENSISKQSSADLCGTPFVDNMFFIFLPKITDG
jgi:hypothetical protein